MQSIATLVQNDPYLKMPMRDRITAQRERRARLCPSPAVQGPPLLYCMPEPKPTPPVYRMWFDDLVAASELLLRTRHPTVHEVQVACALHYGVSLADLLCSGRTSDLMRPRQVAYFLSRHLTMKSFPEIGRRFGGRDHTSIMSGVSKIARLMKYDEYLAAAIQTIRTDLAARGLA